MANVADDDLKLALGYLRNLARQFENPPENAAAMFYHTLSYEGDVAEGKRLGGLIERLSNGSLKATGPQDNAE